MPRKQVENSAPPRGSEELRAAILAAAEAVGFDGQGHRGVVGYLMRLAALHPTNFVPLLARLVSPHGAEPVEYGYDLNKLTDDELLVFERLLLKVQVPLETGDGRLDAGRSAAS